MRNFLENLRVLWFWMLDPPWRLHSYGDNTELFPPTTHWYEWFMGWGWTLAGVVLGALVAPSLVQAVGLVGTPHQDWLLITVAVLAGFVVQVLGQRVSLLEMPAWNWLVDHFPLRKLSQKWKFRLADISVVLFDLPAFVIVGVGICLYFTWVGLNQSLVNISLVGGLLIKVLLIPAIWGALKSRAFKLFMRWLRGGKDTKKAD